MPLPTIPSGNVASALPSGYDVDNSCRFDGSSAVMEKTFGSAGNRKTFTMSCWMKRSSLSSHQRVWGWKNNGGGYGLIWEGSDRYDALRAYVVAGGSDAGFLTNRLFRDTAAWLNIVLKVDTTQSTEADRMRLYINGVEETSFASRTYPNHNEDTHINLDNKCRIGCNPVADNSYFGGYLAEVCFIDGSALAPTEFGEFDEDSPTIWKPKDVSGLTFGSNGFYLDFADSGDLGDDESGNGNDFTEANLSTHDQTSDTPTNNFATFNSLIRVHSSMSLAEGNCKATTGNAYMDNGSNSFFSTIGMTAGKWYWEVKVITAPSTTGLVGIAFDLENFHQRGTSANAYNLSYTTKGFSYNGAGSIGNDGDGWTSTGYDSYTANDILSFALDLDNNKFYVGKYGTWQNSGDPTSGSTGTGAKAITAGETYFAGVSDNAGSAVYVYEANFGNPPYSNSSSVADANGYGAFEYAVPSGYHALCTKNLGSDGG